MGARILDRKLATGRDVSADLNVARARWPGEEQRGVSVDFPGWMIGALDRETTRFGVTRQSTTKVWIAARLDRATP